MAGECPLCGVAKKYQIPDPDGVIGKKYCRGCGTKYMGKRGE